MKKVLSFFLFFVTVVFLWLVNYSATLGGFAVEKTYEEYFSSKPVSVSAAFPAFTNFFKCGEEFTVKEGFDAEEFFSRLNAKVVLRESSGKTESVYAYSDKLKYFVKIGDKKVNLHVCVSGDKVVVGSPMIFGSF